ncbi:MAG: TetR/AcrR family transcriptional regulator [Thermoleophilia bacterium]
MGDTAKRIAGPERRRMIIDSARASFAELGYFGASTAAIAAGAGCSEAVLYRHFSSKAELLLAVMREIATGVVGDLDGPGSSGPDAVDLLVRRAGEIHGTPKGRQAIRLVTLAISAADEPGVRDALLEAFSFIRRTLIGLLAAGQASGSVRRDMPAEDLAWLWHGLLMAGGMRLSVDPDDRKAGVASAVRALARLTRGDGES